MTLGSNLRAALFFVGALTLGVPALASPDFPSEVKDHLGASRIPSCTVCHQTNAGGFGTVDKDFGIALQARGLFAGDTAGLDSALDKLADDAVDSDGDGVIDTDEIKVGTDPNTVDAPGVDGGPAVATGPEAVKYGFGCAATPLDGNALMGGLLALLGGATLARRRRAAR